MSAAGPQDGTTDDGRSFDDADPGTQKERHRKERQESIGLGRQNRGQVAIGVVWGYSPGNQSDAHGEVPGYRPEEAPLPDDANLRRRLWLVT